MPDARKGERLIMVTTRAGATRAEVQKWMKDYGATELMHPSEIISLEAMPLLGSGKTDYVELDRLVRGKLGLATGA
jgi:acyl-[acyl-carrier-protein]-phospholipid O-acyltransferase/long-chain-fatty-acid--[acyl-carrier-protein] ligase